MGVNRRSVAGAVKFRSMSVFRRLAYSMTSTRSSIARSPAACSRNSGYGIGTELGQSGIEGPSTFPRSLRFEYKPSANTVIRAAALDGVPRRPARIRGADSAMASLPYRIHARLSHNAACEKGSTPAYRRNGIAAVRQGGIGAWRYTTTHSIRPTPGDARYSPFPQAFAESSISCRADRGRQCPVYLGIRPDRFRDPAVERFGRSASTAVSSPTPPQRWVDGLNGDLILQQRKSESSGVPKARWSSSSSRRSVRPSPDSARPARPPSSTVCSMRKFSSVWRFRWANSRQTPSAVIPGTPTDPTE